MPSSFRATGHCSAIILASGSLEKVGLQTGNTPRYAAARRDNETVVRRRQLRNREYRARIRRSLGGKVAHKPVFSRAVQRFAQARKRLRRPLRIQIAGRSNHKSENLPKRRVQVVLRRDKFLGQHPLAPEPIDRPAGSRFFRPSEAMHGLIRQRPRSKTCRNLARHRQKRTFSVSRGLECSLRWTWKPFVRTGFN